MMKDNITFNIFSKKESWASNLRIYFVHSPLVLSQKAQRFRYASHMFSTLAVYIEFFTTQFIKYSLICFYTITPYYKNLPNSIHRITNIIKICIMISTRCHGNCKTLLAKSNLKFKCNL